MSERASRLTKIITRAKGNEYLFLSIVAVFIGVLGGYGAVIFRYAILFFQTLFYGSAEEFITIATNIVWWKKLFFPVTCQSQFK